MERTRRGFFDRIGRIRRGFLRVKYFSLSRGFFHREQFQTIEERMGFDRGLSIGMVMYSALYGFVGEVRQKQTPWFSIAISVLVFTVFSFPLVRRYRSRKTKKILPLADKVNEMLSTEGVSDEEKVLALKALLRANT